MNSINECIDIYAAKGERPFPYHILEYLGQNDKNVEEYMYELYDIIELILKQKGFKIKSGHYQELENTDRDTTDLSNISMQELLSPYRKRSVAGRHPVAYHIYLKAIVQPIE